MPYGWWHGTASVLASKVRRSFDHNSFVLPGTRNISANSATCIKLQGAHLSDGYEMP